MRSRRGVLSPTLAALIVCCVASFAAIKTQAKPTAPLPQRVASGRATAVRAADWAQHRCLHDSECESYCAGYPNFMCKGADPNAHPPRYGVCFCWE